MISSGLVMLLLIMLSEQSSLLQLMILWNIDAGNRRQHERIDRQYECQYLHSYEAANLKKSNTSAGVNPL